MRSTVARFIRIANPLWAHATKMCRDRDPVAIGTGLNLSQYWIRLPKDWDLLRVPRENSRMNNAHFSLSVP